MFPPLFLPGWNEFTIGLSFPDGMAGGKGGGKPGSFLSSTTNEPGGVPFEREVERRREEERRSHGGRRIHHQGRQGELIGEETGSNRDRTGFKWKRNDRRRTGGEWRAHPAPAFASRSPHTAWKGVPGSEGYPVHTRETWRRLQCSSRRAGVHPRT